MLIVQIKHGSSMATHQLINRERKKNSLGIISKTWTKSNGFFIQTARMTMIEENIFDPFVRIKSEKLLFD